MSSTYSITDAQARLPGLVRESIEAPVRITRRNQTVAYLISKRNMDAIAETLEVLGNPKAMKAIREHREGKTAFVGLESLDED